jgi:hypothetical protein
MVRVLFWPCAVPGRRDALLRRLERGAVRGVGDFPLETVATSIYKTGCRTGRSGAPRCALSPLAMAASRQFSRGFWGPPSFYELQAVFSELFPGGLFLLALVVVWGGLARHADTKTNVFEVQPAESLGWFFLCIPLAGFVLAEVKTNAFLARYFIGALPGVPVAFSCWLWRHFHNTYRISAGILLLFVMWGAANEWMTVRHAESIDASGYKMEQKAFKYLRIGRRSTFRRQTLLCVFRATHISHGPVLFKERMYSAHAFGFQSGSLCALPCGARLVKLLSHPVCAAL